MKSRKALLLIIVPLLLLTDFFSKNQQQTSFWQSNIDPEYVYLLNSLSFAYDYMCADIWHIDHPGTPLQIIGAIIVKFTYWSQTTSEDLITHVIKNPELYLYSITYTLSFLSICLVILVGLVGFTISKNVYVALFFQNTPFISPVILNHLFFRVSPEPILINGLLILMLIVFLIYHKQLKGSFSFAIQTPKNLYKSYQLKIFVLSLASAMGFCLASKITVLPVLIFIFFFIEKLEDKLITFILTGLFFIFFTFPIVREYPRFIDWIVGISSHTGRYGSGEKGLVNLAYFSENMFIMLSKEWLLTLVIIINFSTILYLIFKKEWNHSLSILIGFLLAEIVGLVIVAKHFEMRYLIPTLLIIPINLYILLHIYRLSTQIKNYIILGFISLSILSNFEFSELRSLMKSKEISTPHYLQENPNYTYIISSDFSECSIPTFMIGLELANSYTRRIYKEYLKQIYGERYFYIFPHQRFSDWEGNGYTLTEVLHKTNKKLVFRITDECFEGFSNKEFSLEKLAPQEYLVIPKQLVY